MCVVWNRSPSVDLPGESVLESKETKREELEKENFRKRESRKGDWLGFKMKPLLLEGA